MEEADTELVRRTLAALGWRGPARVLTKLAGGASGSQVFLLELGGERTVLKVTEDSRWRTRARHEVAVYGEAESTLGAFLPAVRGAQFDRHAVRLLLAAYPPYPPARAVSEGAWVALAGQLGRLHAAPISGLTWLKANAWPAPDEVANALRGWESNGVAPLAQRAARLLPEARQRLAGMATGLTHGDCHTGNLLQSPDGRTLWADWQEVCLGTGLEDLVFLWQRAEFDGGSPPREAMTAAYTMTRSLRLDGDLRSALAAIELRLLLVAWPPFLPYGSKDRQLVMTRRLPQLVEELSA